jgi:methylated-DNA-[protein]-cysteine S-methyltransferase
MGRNSYTGEEEMTNVSSTVFDSQIGMLRLFADNDTATLIAITWEGETPRAYLNGSIDLHTDDRTPILAQACDELGEYFKGHRTAFGVPLTPVGTEFQRAAWKALTEIPYGETSTYSMQALRIGNPKAVRAVGSANGRNPIPIIVPCHRVIGADGSLTGFAGGLDAKRWLLEHERRVAGNPPADGQLSLLR